MKAANFATGQYVMLKDDKKRSLTDDVKAAVRGLKFNRPYRIVRGVSPNDPAVITIEVNGKILAYSIFLFTPLSEEESKMANILEGF